MGESAVILAGDIGGTKTVLALYSAERGVAGGAVREARFESGAYGSLEAVIREFLRDAGATPSAAAFGVAGPVGGGRSQITNLSWAIDAEAIGAAFGIPRVSLLNDLESIALAVPRLRGDDLATLSPGAGEARGNRVVVAPGTGLGIGFLIWDGEGYRAQASEAGHTSFAPRSAVEIRLLEHLIGRYGHVSFERVCSGSFLPNIYDYLRREGGYAEPDWLRQELEGAQDRTPVIVQAALAHKADLCEATLDVFVNALGTVAGNMALSLLATGGIYLGGGIPPRILERLRRPDFLAAIADKGRFVDFVADIPVHVIRDAKAALHGAAWFAQDSLAGR
jgi:glucokinase